MQITDSIDIVILILDLYSLNYMQMIEYVKIIWTVQ